MHMPIKVGVFFGGMSREREISFSGGRTVCDHLDRNRFKPVPVFVDSLGNFILLDWKYLYQGTIREFYPSVTDTVHHWNIPLYIESIEGCSAEQQEQFVATIGSKIEPSHFKDHFDMVFLCLHGPYGEDGSIQGLLDWYQIPYVGASILPAALGVHKVFQKKLLRYAGFLVPPAVVLSQQKWLDTKDKEALLEHVIATVGLPFVVKSSTQGSSIGVSIVQENTVSAFETAVHRAFFIEALSHETWQQWTIEDKKKWLYTLTDVREGIGFPLCIGKHLFYTPCSLLTYLETYFKTHQATCILVNVCAEETILIEFFIAGREFSCIVLEAEKGLPIALSPTEMLKENVHFDYRAKYLPGIVRKQTPMDLTASMLSAIRKKAVALFQLLDCQVYARIDGFITNENEIVLNDPNTTAGMNPSSFLFHQAAEIGLNPTQLLTFLIQRSLQARKEAHRSYLTAQACLERLI